MLLERGPILPSQAVKVADVFPPTTTIFLPTRWQVWPVRSNGSPASPTET